MHTETTQKVIFETESKFSGKIEVVDTGKIRKLLVNGILQSINYDYPHIKRLVWGSVVDLLKDKEPNLMKVLFMGLGGGCMQKLVSQSFPDAKLASIEIDEEIINIAKQYFGLDSIPNHTIIHEDALRVVHHPTNYGLNKEGFQVIIVDVVIGEEYPDVCKTGNFLNAVKDMCMPGGLVIFVRNYREHHQEDVDTFVSMCEDFFKDCNSFAIAGKTNSDNLVIYGRA